MSSNDSTRSVSPTVAVGTVGTATAPVTATAPSGDAIKRFVAQALNLPDNTYVAWDVIDVYPKDNPQLALAHYNEQYDPYIREYEPLRRIRGVVVDLTTGAVVADSYGYTQTLPCYDSLSLEKSSDNPDGYILVQTEIAEYANTVEVAPNEVPSVEIDVRKFDRKTTRLFLGYEGVLVRVFKWRDQLMFSTHRRIDASRSHWGGRTMFLDLYKQLNGPEFSELFGPEPTSPYCHLFLIVHNDLRLATSTRDNRVLYLGSKKVWSEEVYATKTGPYYWSSSGTSGTPEPTTETENYQFPIKLPKFDQVEPEVFSPVLDRAMFRQPEVDIETANKFMFPGKHAARVPPGVSYPVTNDELVIDYNDDGTVVNEIYSSVSAPNTIDDRLGAGDFIILYTQTDEGRTVVYRLESPSFEYRVMVTGNDPNIYHRFVSEMTGFTKGDPSELLDIYPRYTGSDGRAMPLDYPQGRQVYWWTIFYDAVPPHYKDEVDEFYNRYHQDINDVSGFIISDYPNITDEEELKRINPKTRRRIDDIRRIALSAGGKRTRKPRSIVKGLLYKETGPSLYKMMSTVRNIKKYRARLAEQEAEQV